MPITAQNQHRNDLAKQQIDASPLNADAKADLDEQLDLSLQLTNGLPPAEKLDALGNALYQLTRIMCVHIAEVSRAAPASWKDVCIKCRREIFALGCFAIAGLVYVLKIHPDIVKYLELIHR